MDVEATVARRIAEATGVRAYLEVPKDEDLEPDCDFITVEQTGGGAGMLDPVQLDIDCWSSKRKGGRKRARAVARLVEAAVLDLDEEPNIFHPTVENTYRMNDPDTGRPRYVVQAQVWVCE